MNDKQIQAFLMISELGSMNKAAERLFISQPALKKRMDMLEDELGIALFRRDSSGCVLTQAGEVLRNEIAPLYAELNKVIEKTKRVNKRSELRICAMPDISMREQDEVLIAFARENPDVAAKRIPLPTNQWFDAVASGKADICCGFFVKGKTEVYAQKKLAFHALGRKGKAVCVVSSKHPLAEKKRIVPKDLIGYRVYAGPLLYHDSGLREFAQDNGFGLECDESAGKRYEMIDQCESGVVYIHPKGYSEDLKPLAVIPLSGFSVYSGWVYAEGKNELIERFLRFYDAQS